MLFFKTHVNEDVANSKLQVNIVELYVTVTIGEDGLGGEKEFTTKNKLEIEKYETCEQLFCFMKVQLIRNLIILLFSVRKKK